VLASQGALQQRQRLAMQQVRLVKTPRTTHHLWPPRQLLLLMEHNVPMS
jgi:hypothetical protein